MSASRATAFDRLAPDQRAAVELVLRQGRSYGELSDLLGMPEETIRSRARGGLAALAPDLPEPPRGGEIADWLLGQQSEAHAARTRALLRSDPAAHTWAATIAAPLREVTGGEAVPELPTSPDAEAPRVNGTSARKASAEPPAPAAGGEATFWEDDVSTPERDAVVRERGASSRLGGALLIGAAVLVVAVVIAVVFIRGGADDPDPVAATVTPAATATPATTAVAANQILLRGPAGSSSVGLMELFRANDDTVRFAIAAQGVAPNEGDQRYSLWLTRESGKPLLLGDVRDAVGKDGALTAAGPGNEDTDEFLDWLQTYDSIAITLDDEGAKEPGKVILSGALPTGEG
jgi:hypothetical protein